MKSEKWKDKIFIFKECGRESEKTIKKILVFRKN